MCVWTWVCAKMKLAKYKYIHYVFCECVCVGGCERVQQTCRFERMHKKRRDLQLFLECIWHDTFLCVICPISTCEMTHSKVWHASFTCVIWRILIGDMTYAHCDKYPQCFFGEGFSVIYTGWHRVIGCLKLQVIFCKRATNYRALLQKMTCKDKASYGSSQPFFSSSRAITSLLGGCFVLWVGDFFWSELVIFVFGEGFSVIHFCACLIHVFDRSDSHVCHDAFLCISSFEHVTHISLSHIRMYINLYTYIYMSTYIRTHIHIYIYICISCTSNRVFSGEGFFFYSCVWHVSFMQVIFPMHMCDIRHVTRRIPTCGMHASFIHFQECLLGDGFSVFQKCDVLYWIRVAKTHKMLYLYRSFSTKEPYD